MGLPALEIKDIVEAIHKCHGLVYHVARTLGCSAQAIYNYIKTNEEVAQALAEERGRFVDDAELKLVEAVKSREPWAIQMTLRTLGRDRGYAEQTQLNVTAQAQVIITLPDNGRGDSSSTPTNAASQGSQETAPAS